MFGKLPGACTVYDFYDIYYLLNNDATEEVNYVYNRVYLVKVVCTRPQLRKNNTNYTHPLLVVASLL